MSLMKKMLVGAMFAAGLLAAGSASAASICTSCSYNAFPNNNNANSAFLGVHNPNTSDDSGFVHTGLGTGSFTDWWVFKVDPAGLATINGSIGANSGNTIGQFMVTVYSVTGLGAGNCTAQMTLGSCDLSAATLNVVTSAAGPTGGQGSAFFSFNNPVNGYYALKVQGTINGGSTLQQGYSGNLNTNPAPIPEPGSLALVALGLLAAGSAARRRA